jgi:hypothetical protein
VRNGSNKLQPTLEARIHAGEQQLALGEMEPRSSARNVAPFCSDTVLPFTPIQCFLLLRYSASFYSDTVLPFTPIQCFLLFRYSASFYSALDTRCFFIRSLHRPIRRTPSPFPSEPEDDLLPLFLVLGAEDFRSDWIGRPDAIATLYSLAPPFCQIAYMRLSQNRHVIARSGRSHEIRRPAAHRCCSFEIYLGRGHLFDRLAS